MSTLKELRKQLAENKSKLQQQPRPVGSSNTGAYGNDYQQKRIPRTPAQRLADFQSGVHGKRYKQKGTFYHYTGDSYKDENGRVSGGNGYGGSITDTQKTHVRTRPYRLFGGKKR